MIPSRTRISRKQVSLVVVDLLILAAIPFISLYLYFLIRLGFGFRMNFTNFDIELYVSNILLFMIVFYIMDLHNFRRNFAKPQEIFNIFLTLSIACILSIFYSYLVNKPPYGRGIYFVYMSVLMVLVTGYRIIFSKLAITRFYKRKALIVGAGAGGTELASMIRENADLNIEVLCLLDIQKEKEGERVCGYSIVCQHGSLRESVRQHKPDLIILAMRSSRYQKMIKDLIWCSQQGIEIHDLASFYEEVAGRIPLKYVSDLWVLFSYMNQPKLYFRRLKRLVDLVSSAILLLLASPFMVMTAIAIKLDSKGPVFYRQTRVGKDSEPFKLIKFRSMIKDAEQKTGAVWAGERDPRITRVGKIIRFLRIDELPQLFNVFKGDMSLIGPRPERPEFVDNFLGKSDDKSAVIPFYGERLSAKPGITGWAQVMYPYAASFEESLKKLEYDLYYIKNMSFLLDFSIILKTIRVVLLGRGAK